MQTKEVLSQDLALGLLRERRIAIALLQVRGDLEIPEGLQRPSGVEDRRLASIDDLVFSAPEEQLAQCLRELARRATDEVDRRRQRGVEVRVPDQLPADLVEKGEPDVVDHEVQVREVRSRAIHVPGLCVLDRLRSKGHTLVNADQLDA